jgi:adenosylhomocysteine nucleosidase
VKAEGRRQRAEGSPKGEARQVLVCFAVKEEARAFQKLAMERGNVQVILVGMGKRNAERAIRAALAKERPTLVLTCGFAGGLRPELTMGTVVFAADPETGLEPALLAAGAKPARFHCAERVVATAKEKQTLWEATGADAVEMESQVICAVSREQNIPSATVRVILDTANEDLPLDFNQVMTANQKLSYGKLALALAKSPGKVGALIKLQQQSKAAAEKLGQALASVPLKSDGTV